MEFALEPRWDVSLAEAMALQRELAARARLEDGPETVELVAGVDLAAGASPLGAARPEAPARAAVVVWRLSTGEVVERVVAELPLRMPYIPGLLSFREGPVLEVALRRVVTEPDLILVDGQGVAHPRGCGIACHIGVLLDRPTVGVAKSRLFGRARDPGPNPGDREPLLDPQGRCIGMVLRTRAGARPVYVSPGHRITPERAADWTMRCVRGHRLPEPLFLADRMSKERPPG